MSIYKGTELLAGVATNTIENAHELFDFIWSDHIKNSMSWLNAGTFSWQSGAVYVAAYNHLVADNSGGTSQTETVGSYTITYVLADDGHKITTDETTVANIYAESGVAWYYVLDTVNTRFKLPRINPAREELISFTQAPVRGNGIALGVTDGTNYKAIATVSTSNRAQLYLSSTYGSVVGTTAVTYNANCPTLGVTTDGSKSGLVADLSNSTKTSVYKGHKYLYFYVGNFSQSATEQTAGLNASLFNGKIDTDMSNMNASSTAKETINSWGMPDYTAGVTAPTTNTLATTNLYVSLETGTNLQSYIYINDAVAARGWEGFVCAYVPKGAYFRVSGGTNGLYYPLIGG